MCDTNDPFAVPTEFGRIQQTIATAVQQDVVCKDGSFFNSLRGMTNEVIEGILAAQCDERPFMTLQGVLPFPPTQRLTEELKKQKEKEKEEKEKKKQKQKEKM